MSKVARPLFNSLGSHLTKRLTSSSTKENILSNRTLPGSNRNTRSENSVPNISRQSEYPINSLATTTTDHRPTTTGHQLLPHPTQFIAPPSDMVREAQAHLMAENLVSLKEFKIVSADQKITTKGLHYCCAIFLQNQEKIGLAHVFGIDPEGNPTDLEIVKQFFDEFDTIDQITFVTPIISYSSALDGGPKDGELNATRSTNLIEDEINRIKEQNNISSPITYKRYYGLSGTGYEASYNNGKITVQREKSQEFCVIL